MAEVFQLVVAEATDQLIVLRVQGRLDAQSSPQLVEKCNEIRQQRKGLVLNLAAVSFIASSGIGALLALTEEFHEAHLSVRFAELSEEVMNVIELLNLDQFLNIDGTEREAIDSLAA